MKNKLSFVLCVFSLSIANIANSAPMPNKCPDLKSIQAVGWSKVYESPHKPSTYALIQENNKYDTGSEWSFVFGEFNAKDKNDAVVVGEKLFNSLNLIAGPIGDENMCACHYMGDQVIGVAMSPPVAIPDAVLKL